MKMKYLISESQTNQTIIKLCDLAFESIRKSAELTLDEIPSYLSLESLLVIGLIEEIKFFNVSKIYPPTEKSPNKNRFTVECKIYYFSINYHDGEFFSDLLYDIKMIVKERFKIDLKINVVDTINKNTNPQW